MTSTFFGLNIGLRALVASQIALDVSAHNASNASTDGYSRQRVNLVETEPFSYPSFTRSGEAGQIGTGVSVAMISRVRDAFVDLQLRSENGLSGSWDTRDQELTKLQDVFPEPGTTGLGNTLGQLWNAWQDVAADPTSSATRTALLDQVSTFASQVNSAAGQIRSLVAGEDFAAGQAIDEVNSIAGQIASLNAQIKRVAVTGDQPNDLADQRDLLFDRLSSLVHATLEPQTDGTVKVTVGGTDLVTDDRARLIVKGSDANGHIVPTWSSGSPVVVGTGSLGQLIQLRDTDLPAYLTRLDTFAAGIATAVNNLHHTGVDQNGDPGLDVFTSSDGGPITAATIQLNTALAGSPRLVAAAAAVNQPGDGSIAGAIADLRSAAVVGTAGNLQSPNDFYAAFVGDVGADARQSGDMSANQALVTQHLQTRRESLSGVSLDEEATDMVRFQHQYEAAARIITTMDSVLDTLINKTGLVGR